MLELLARLCFEDAALPTEFTVATSKPRSLVSVVNSGSAVVSRGPPAPSRGTAATKPNLADEQKRALRRSVGCADESGLGLLSVLNEGV